MDAISEVVQMGTTATAADGPVADEKGRILTGPWGFFSWAQQKENKCLSKMVPVFFVFYL